MTTIEERLSSDQLRTVATGLMEACSSYREHIRTLQKIIDQAGEPAFEATRSTFRIIEPEGAKALQARFQARLQETEAMIERLVQAEEITLKAVA